MKVALFTEAAAAGVGRHVADLAGSLLENHHAVHILYSDRRMDSQFADGIRRLQMSGAHAACIEMRHTPGASDLEALRALRNYLRKNAPFDVLHCHSTKAGLIGRIAAIGMGIRTVYTPHAFLTMSPSATIWQRAGARSLEWALSKAGDSIICVSEEERDHAVNIGLPSEKLFVVPNGIDIDAVRHLRSRRVEVRQRFGLEDADVCIGFVGRLCPQKSPGLLLEAFARLREPNTKLVIVGDGPLLPRLKEQTRLRALEDRVIFAGGMNGALAMAGFDLLALPSAYEAFPYVLLEALAVGLPIVATAVGGVSSLVSQEQNGFVAPIGRVPEFSDALHRISTNSELRSSMATASAALATRFNIGRMVSETLTVYDGLRKRSLNVVPAEA